MSTGADLEVEGTVDPVFQYKENSRYMFVSTGIHYYLLVLFCTENTCQIFGHYYYDEWNVIKVFEFVSKKGEEDKSIDQSVKQREACDVFPFESESGTG